MAYIAPIHQPSSVRHALKLTFLEAAEEALVVAKSNRLEIYRQTSEGLSLVHKTSIYGYITMLQRLRPATSTTDHLFIGTDRYQYFTLSWDPSRQEIRTEQSYLDQADKVLRDSRNEDRCHIEPSRRYMTLELYDGVVTVIPLAQATGKGKPTKRKSTAKEEPAGILGNPVQVRIEELCVRSSAFVDVESTSKQKPRLAILWEDNADKPQLKIREMVYFPDAADQAYAELSTVAEYRGDLSLGASHLIPVAAPIGGFLVLDETHVTYLDKELKDPITKELDEDSTVWATWEKVDDTRWLLADDYGRLYFLMIIIESSEVVDWRLDLAGYTSKASNLVYLDDGLVYVGSHCGNSQVVKIEESGLRVIQTFDNIAPIIDFAIMDLGRGTDASSMNEFSSGQARLVTASGAWQDGSIRSVRSGVGLEQLGSLGEIHQITDMWGLSSVGDRQLHDTLLVTFVDESRVFRFDCEAAVEELDNYLGLELSQPTLLASNISSNRILQVSETKVQVADIESGMITSSWQAPEGENITATSCNEDRLVLVTAGAHLHVFDITNDLSLFPFKAFPADSQIASVAMPSSSLSICVVAFWQSASVALVDLQSLQSLHSQVLDPDGTSVPRSVLIADITENSPPTLFVAMVDGAVVTFSLNIEDKSLTNMTRITLGSEPVKLKILPRGSKSETGTIISSVFASCEQPCLIYHSDGRIVFSAVNSDKGARVCSFDSQAYPGAVAVASFNELQLALVDTERTTQIQTLPLDETVRCVAYCEQLKMFGMGCIKRTLDQLSKAEDLQSSFKIANEVTFEELDSFQLHDEELVECVIAVPVEKKDESEPEFLFAVGTSWLEKSKNQAEESIRGRILLFQVKSDKKLRLMAEKKVKGACRTLSMCDGKIVAGLVKTVVVYALTPVSTHSLDFNLQKLVAYRTATNPIAISVTPSTKRSPALIAVADLMKSVSILALNPALPRTGLGWNLTEVARHFDTLWTTAVTAIGDNQWLASDMEGNLVVLRRNINGVTDDDKRRLAVTSEMKLGEVINSIIPLRNPIETALSNEPPTPSTPSNSRTEDTSPPTGPIVTPQAFLATIEGGVYLMGTICPGYQDFLIRLQQAVAARTKGLGYMPWAKYRAFETEVREADEPERFVDGELVERFLGFSEEDMHAVVEELGLGFDVERVKGVVEALRLLH